jgi:hypothetical protein
MFSNALINEDRNHNNLWALSRALYGDVSTGIVFGEGQMTRRYSPTF